MVGAARTEGNDEEGGDEEEAMGEALNRSDDKEEREEDNESEAREEEEREIEPLLRRKSCGRRAGREAEVARGEEDESRAALELLRGGEDPTGEATGREEG